MEAGIELLSESADPIVLDSPVFLDNASGEGRLSLRGREYLVGNRWEKDPSPCGGCEVRVQDNGLLQVVLRLPLETYLCGVVPSEIGVEASLEAMKAQAVAARSEAWSALIDSRYAGDNYDLCSDVMCQVFTGLLKETTKTEQAVKETRSLVMFHDGEPASAFYASTCGGHSENSENVWKDRGFISYCRGRFDGSNEIDPDLTREENLREWLSNPPDCYCNSKNHGIPDWAKKKFRWQREISAEEAASAAAKIKDVGRIKEIKPLRRGVSGRLIEVEFIGEKGSVIAGPELTIRRLFKPSLWSAAFVVDATSGEEFPGGFMIRGAGSGHGVGMCQVGAIAMAAQSKTFAEILKHYYKGIEIRRVY